MDADPVWESKNLLFYDKYNVVIVMVSCYFLGNVGMSVLLQVKLLVDVYGVLPIRVHIKFVFEKNHISS